jgi:nicotinamide-nucleotide amidase
MKVIFVVVGDEILLGQVVDTNAAYLGQAFATEGLELVSKWTVRDREDEMLDALHRAMSKADLVVFSGGLGPTSDDLTKPLLTKAMGGHLRRNFEVESGIRAWFKARGREPGPLNLAQADLPDNCTLLHNPLGTAQGMLWQYNEVFVAALPGVPYEFKYLVDKELIPYMKDKGLVRPMVHHTLMVARLTDWELKWRSEGIRLAYLPRPGLVRLRLSLYANSEKKSAGSMANPTPSPDALPAWTDAAQDQRLGSTTDLESMRHRVVVASKEIKDRLEGHVYGENELSLEECIGLILKDKNQKVFFAESCTGGALSARFIRVPGASNYVHGGLVAYANELKVTELGVTKSMLDAHGAVSTQVVGCMAREAVRRYGTTYAVAISGIAGPEGGSLDKPVGLICLGIHGPEGTLTYRRSLGENRELIIERAVMTAMFLFWRLLVGQPVLDEVNS